MIASKPNLADLLKFDGQAWIAAPDWAGAEIVAAINPHLGGMTWQESGDAAGGSRAIRASECDAPDISLELPAAVNRRDFLLGCSAAGAVTTTKQATAANIDDLAAHRVTAVESVAALRQLGPRSPDDIVYVRGYARANDGGRGEYTWDAASKAGDDGGTVVQGLGEADGRWIRNNDQYVSIKAFGAIGNGTTDDTAAVQRAVDANVPLYIPRGTYLLSSAITWDPMTRPLIMVGEIPVAGRVRLAGAAALGEEPMFHRRGRYMKANGTYYNTTSGDPANTIGFGVILKNIEFIVASSNKVSAAFEIQGCKQSYIENCCFAYVLRGLTLCQSNFDTTVMNCYFRGIFNKHYKWRESAEISRMAWGLYASGHKFLNGIAAVGSGVGVYLVGTGNVLNGARLEENHHGLILGDKEYNVTGISAGRLSRSFVSGISYEANAIGILGAGLTSFTTLSGISGQGSPAGGNRPDSEIGIWLQQTGTAVTFLNCGAGGTFTKGDIINETDTPLLFSDGSISSGGGGKFSGAWNALSKFRTVPPKYAFLRTPTFGSAVSARHRTITAFHDLMLPGLTGLNIKDRAVSGAAQGGPIFSKNLGGVVTPAKGAMTTAVKFSPESDQSASDVAFSTVTVAADGRATLRPGTYYYATTLVGPHAETGISYTNLNAHAHRTVMLAAGQNVSFTFHGDAVGYRRRVYRSTVPGEFTGYWEFPDNHGFTDDGNTAFTGTGGKPPRDASMPSRVEDDANYEVVATPSWSTSVFITNKATTGFTLNFGTAAPDASQTVAWLMFRP